MNRIQGVKSKLVLLIYSIQVIINWIYVLWASKQPDIIINSWLALIPFFGFIYFAIAIYALLSMYNKMPLGLVLALIILLSGSIAAVISYEIAFKTHLLISILIVPLIILNGCVGIFMTLNKKYFI